MKLVTLQAVLHGLRQRIARRQVRLPWVKVWRRCTFYLRTLCAQHVTLHCVWRAVPVLFSCNVPLSEHVTISLSNGYLKSTKSQWDHCLYFLLDPRQFKTKVQIDLCNILYKVLTSRQFSYFPLVLWLSEQCWVLKCVKRCVPRCFVVVV